MSARRNISLLLAALASFLNQVYCCSYVPTIEIYPDSITLTLYAELRCNHDGTLNFDSYYVPSGDTLTTTNLPKYEIISRNSHSILIVNDIEQSDIGEYQCNFRDVNNDECFAEIQLQLDITFCTTNWRTYHHYIGETATLECCVQNQASHHWVRDGSDQAIAEGGNIEFDGTSLRIRDVSLDDEGVYRCVAVEAGGESISISATLKVYDRLSITISPHQKIVNISDKAELTCTVHSYPLANIVWAREDSTELQLQAGVIEKERVEINRTTVQSVLTFFNVTDEVTGTYRCTGEYSNGSRSALASLQLFGTPSAPQEVFLSIIDQTSINVTWKPPLDYGHLQLLQYLVMWFTMGTDGVILERGSDTVNGSSTGYIIAGLLPVTNYTVTIYAINRRGKGMGSADQSVLTLPSVPGSPVSLQTHQLTSSSVYIEFTVPHNTGGSPITYLRIVSQAGNEEGLTQTHPLTDALPNQRRSHKLVNLKGDTPYVVNVSVGNAIGFGPHSTAYFKTFRPGYPATPTLVQALEVGTTRVRLSWEVVDVGKPSTEYYVRAVKVGQEGEGELFMVKAEEVVMEGTRETAEISPLAPETCYTFTVAVRNEERLGLTSEPSNLTCTLSCQQATCNSVAGIEDSESSGPTNAQLIPILVVVVVVAIVVVLAVVLVVLLSWRASSQRKSRHLQHSFSSHNQNFATSSISSSHMGSIMDPSVSSLPWLNRQTSQNSSSTTEVEDAPTTSSSTISENPFHFGPAQFQNGSPQYQNRTSPQYQNGSETLSSVGSHSSIGMVTEHPQPGIGVRMMGSYPLFPIPENGVAMGNHIENSAPALPIRAHLTSDATIMTDNPAFASPIEEDTPPPIPPYRSNSFSDSDSSQPPLHIHTHHHAQDPHPPIPPRIHSSHSVPFLGESFSQASSTPAMPMTNFFLPADEEEEDEVQFMDNSAYESAPQPASHRRDPSPPPLPPHPSTPHTSHSVTSLSGHSHTNLSVSSFSRGQSASPVFLRRGSAQSTGSDGNEGPPPRFEIAQQQDSDRGGRGRVFETVTIKSRV